MEIISAHLDLCIWNYLLLALHTNDKLVVVSLGDCIFLCFQKNVHSTNFVEYLCLSVLPVFKEISYCAADSKELTKKYQVDILKHLAEMVLFCGDLGRTEECVQNVYNCLIVSCLCIAAVVVVAAILFTLLENKHRVGRV